MCQRQEHGHAKNPNASDPREWQAFCGLGSEEWQSLPLAQVWLLQKITHQLKPVDCRLKLLLYSVPSKVTNPPPPPAVYSKRSESLGC